MQTIVVSEEHVASICRVEKSFAHEILYDDDVDMFLRNVASLQDPHGATSQKTLFIVNAVRTSTLA
jgi:hypothetical protein